MEENINLTGRFKVVRHTPDGFVEERFTENTVVNDGKTTVASLILSDVVAGSRFDYLAIGLGSTAAEVTQTALVSEVYSRIAGTGTLTGSTATLSGAFGISGTVSISEYGVFNKSTVGSMLCRASGTALSCTSGDTVGVEYSIRT